MSEWKDIKDEPPLHTNEVIVTDGLESYAIAWFRLSDKTWHANIDLFYDGGGFITLDNMITHWREIN